MIVISRSDAFYWAVIVATFGAFLGIVFAAYRG
jgi:hypothetical protein